MYQAGPIGTVVRKVTEQLQDEFDPRIGEILNTTASQEKAGLPTPVFWGLQSFNALGASGPPVGNGAALQVLLNGVLHEVADEFGHRVAMTRAGPAEVTFIEEHGGRGVEVRSLLQRGARGPGSHREEPVRSRFVPNLPVRTAIRSFSTS